MELPLNMRLRLLQPKNLKGQPTLIAALPRDPRDMSKIGQSPCVLEIQLKDPESGTDIWIEIPFYMEPTSVIDTSTVLHRSPNGSKQ